MYKKVGRSASAGGADVGGTSVASAAVVSAAAGRRPEAAEEEGCAWTACTLESDEQDVAGWLKVSPLCQSAGARSSAVRLASPLRAVARRRAWAVGWLSATAHSSTRQTVRAFARQEDSLADDEHHHSCWLIGKAAYAPAYNTDEVSACEAATTGGAAAAVRSAHTVLASRRRAERRRPCDRPTLSSPRRL